MRELPHVRILVTLKQNSKTNLAAEIDKCISAEIPIDCN